MLSAVKLWSEGNKKMHGCRCGDADCLSDGHRPGSSWPEKWDALALLGKARHVKAGSGADVTPRSGIRKKVSMQIVVCSISCSFFTSLPTSYSGLVFCLYYFHFPHIKYTLTTSRVNERASTNAPFDLGAFTCKNESKSIEHRYRKRR